MPRIRENSGQRWIVNPETNVLALKWFKGIIQDLEFGSLLKKSIIKTKSVMFVSSFASVIKSWILESLYRWRERIDLIWPSNKWPKRINAQRNKKRKPSLFSPIYLGNKGNVQGLCQFVDISFTPHCSDDSWTTICTRTTFSWKASWCTYIYYNLKALGVWANGF